MIEIIAILLVGIAFGRLFRRTSAVTGIANRMNITVWILILPSVSASVAIPHS